MKRLGYVEGVNLSWIATQPRGNLIVFLRLRTKSLLPGLT